VRISGNHEVEFHYRPASFRIGAAVSLISLVLIIAAAVVGRDSDAGIHPAT